MRLALDAAGRRSDRIDPIPIDESAGEPELQTVSAADVVAEFEAELVNSPPYGVTAKYNVASDDGAIRTSGSPRRVLHSVRWRLSCTGSSRLVSRSSRSPARSPGRRTPSSTHWRVAFPTTLTRSSSSTSRV